MASTPHLLVDISSHGYGHVSQTSMVVNELVKLRTDLRVTIRSTAPHAILRQRFECEFQHIPLALDFGMKMLNAVDVEVEESAAAYRQFHRDWPARVAREASAISELKPDLLLANVPYLSLAAAHVAKVRSVGMCSLNWADIYQNYCMKDASSRAIHAQMLEAYSSAEHFLKVRPAMEMSNLDNTRHIGPVARIGTSQRLSLARVCNVVEGEKLVLLAMGGMEFRLPVQSWPRIPGVHWIVPLSRDVYREDVTGLESLPFPFTDVLASCDAIITKPGYGIFTEAACAGVPVLYVTRQDWPEESALVLWLKQNNACLEVARSALLAGELQCVLEKLWGISTPPRPVASGAREAAQLLSCEFF